MNDDRSCDTCRYLVRPEPGAKEPYISERPECRRYPPQPGKHRPQYPEITEFLLPDHWCGEWAAPEEPVDVAPGEYIVSKPVYLDPDHALEVFPNSTDTKARYMAIGADGQQHELHPGSKVGYVYGLPGPDIDDLVIRRLDAHRVWAHSDFLGEDIALKWSNYDTNQGQNTSLYVGQWWVNEFADEPEPSGI